MSNAVSRLLPKRAVTNNQVMELNWPLSLDYMSCVGHIHIGSGWKHPDRVYASRSENIRCGESCTGPSERLVGPSDKRRIPLSRDRLEK